MKWGASPREGDSSLRSNNRRSFGLILRISWQSLGMEEKAESVKEEGIPPGEG